MPLIFVHGIGNRDDDAYQDLRERRDELFRRFLFPVIGADHGQGVGNPMWGRYAARLRWDGASLPARSGEALGTGDADDGLAGEIAASEAPGDDGQVLTAMAERDLADVIDALYSAVPEDAGRWDAAAMAAAAEILVSYCRYRERLYPELDQSRRYPWLAQITDDEDLVDTLWREASAWSLSATPTPTTPGSASDRESLGDDDDTPTFLQRGLRILRTAAVQPVTTGAASAVRALAAERTTMFLGDVFAYLGQRGDIGTPGPIITEVADAIEHGCASRSDTQPVVVVAHSMGGNIVYDLMTYYRPDLTVDVLVTVGSQVGLFEELSLFRSSDTALPSVTAPRVGVTDRIRKWINIVDRADVLGYRAEPIFARVRDYKYPTGALWAHGAYLLQPNFHDRVAQRVRQVLS